jgi:hypothetical protein
MADSRHGNALESNPYDAHRARDSRDARNSRGIRSVHGDRADRLWSIADGVPVRTEARSRGEGATGSGHRRRALYAYAKDGTLLAANESPFEKLEKEANHIGDISVHAGAIYAGIEHFLDGRGQNIQIAVYDAKTLAYERSIDWNADSGQVEVSAVAIDPARDAIWMTDWVNGTWLYRYDLKSGAYEGRLHLRAVPQWQQGIAAHRGALFLTADDGDAEEGEWDNLWRLTPEKGKSASFVSHERTFDDFRFPGEIEGLDFDESAGELVVLANRGKRITLGMPKGLYPGYEKEIHELYVYTVSPQ